MVSLTVADVSGMIAAGVFLCTFSVPKQLVKIRKVRSLLIQN